MGLRWDNWDEERRRQEDYESWMTPAMREKKRREDRLVNLFMFCVMAVAVAYLVFEAT